MQNTSSFNLKKGYILLLAVVFLLSFSVVTLEIIKENKFEMDISIMEKSQIQTINEMLAKKLAILQSAVDCSKSSQIFENTRFKTEAFFDYSNYKNCGQENDERFENTDGFVIVNIYSKDKAYNLSAYEKFYKK